MQRIQASSPFGGASTTTLASGQPAWSRPVEGVSGSLSASAGARVEVLTQLGASFDALDRNQDGVLGYGDLSAAAQLQGSKAQHAASVALQSRDPVVMKLLCSGLSQDMLQRVLEALTLQFGGTGLLHQEKILEEALCRFQKQRAAEHQASEEVNLMAKQHRLADEVHAQRQRDAAHPPPGRVPMR